MRLRAGLLLFAFTSAPALAVAADSTAPGEVSAPFPTLHAISIEWLIDGDDDGDATVTVRYRRQGESTYRDGLPLFRVPAGTGQGFSWQNRFAGSIFDLDEATAYEIELELSDPDGGGGSHSMTVETRAMPAVAEGAPVLPATPDDVDAVIAGAAPGSVIELADGTYGEIQVTVDGAEGAPVALRAASPGGAVVEGDVRIDGRAHVIVEGLTVHGKIKFNDAEDIAVLGCTIETIEDGIVAYGSGVTNAVIADNVITGATEWKESALGVDGDNVGEGIVLTGAGNVIAFNRVSGFRDCLSLLEDDGAVDQRSIDMYGNDLSECADDAIEADFSMGNVRVHHNRIRDSFMGISSQPSLGGPTYLYRNVMYNVLFQAFKLQRSSVGDVLFHNTVIKSGDAFSVNTEDVFSRSWVRNNLFLGAPGGTYNGYDSGPGDVMQLPSADASCRFDYDGYGAIGVGAFHGRVGAVTFDSVAEMNASTTEVHGVEVDLSTFAASIEVPLDPFAAPATPSFALADGGGATDRGVALTNINDGFTGDAPDLGAVELGATEPTYGPNGSLGGGAGGSGGAGGGSAQGGGAEGGGSAQGAAGQGGGSGGGDGLGTDEEGCGCRAIGSDPPSGLSARLVLFALAAFGLMRPRRARS